MFNEVHGDKYDYSKVVFKNNDSNVILICPEHGEFKKTPGKIIYQKAGCNKCVGKNLTNEERITEAKKVHGEKYGYDKFVYVKSIKKTIVTCPTHGDFKISPNDHINQGTGCSKCKESKGEKLISQILDNMKIQYTQQKRFNGCTGNSGKKFSKRLPFDFYLPDFNICIEYDGRQHFEPVWGEEQLLIQKGIDNIKDNYCLNNGIKLIRFGYKIKEDEIIKLLINEIL
jgi:very-short-patch-repair endonuclease